MSAGDVAYHAANHLDERVVGPRCCGSRRDRASRFRGRALQGIQLGAGPYGEPQLVRYIADWLKVDGPFKDRARTKRTPDLLIEGEWAIEIKVARPFGDNGKQAENWR